MASTSVKTIQVALTADTTSFEAGLKRSSTAMNRAERDMNRLADQFAKGLIGPQEFAQRLAVLDRDLAATRAGFDGMRGAVARVDQIMRSLETPQERLEQNLRELDQLLKVGAMSADQYAVAVDRIKSAASKPAQSLRSLKDATVDATGGMTMLDRASMLPGVGVYASRVRMLAGAGAALGGAAAAVTGVALTMRNAFRTIDQAGDKAVELGIEPQQFLAISYAAESAGVGVNEIEAALQRSTIAAADAVTGNTKLQQTFARLGISARELSNASPYETLRLIADGLQKVEDPAQRASLAVDLFGKSGTTMLQVLQGGSGAIDEASRQLQFMGNVVTGRGLTAVDDLSKAWAKMKAAFGGVALQLWNDLGPAFVSIVQKLADAVSWVTKLAIAFRNFVTVGKLAGETVEKSTPKTIRISPVMYASQQAIDATKITDAQRKIIDEQVAKDAEEQQRKIDSYFGDLNDKLKALEQQYAKPISAQEKFAQQVRDINRLYDANLITLEKRNQLLGANAAAVAQQRMQEQAKQREEMLRVAKQRSDEIVGGLRENLRGQLESLGKFAATSGPAAIHGGPLSVESFSAFQANKRGVDVAEQQLAIQRKMETHLAELKRRGVALAEAAL